MVHETGHALACYSNKSYACSPEFYNAFYIGLQRYLNDGNTQNVDKIINGERVNVSHGSYCTTNSEECFAECYTLLMMGSADTSGSVITKYFPECLELVKEFLTQIRNMNTLARQK